MRTSKSVRFKCMTADEVRAASVMRVRTRADISDPRMGSLDRCATCGKLGSRCPGHFGHIELPVRVPHPIHLATLRKVAKSRCCVCGSLMTSSTCAGCGGGTIASLNSKMWACDVWDTLPCSHLFITALPVPPLRMRLPNATHDAPLSSLLNRVVFACARYDRLGNTPRTRSGVNAAVTEYMTSPADSGMTGLMSGLKGKQGRMRQNLMGWRVNQAGRAVISPDPTLAPWEVGVPRSIAATLGIRDGDACIINRQPSLHRGSMMAHVARIRPQLTITVSPTVTPPYNADFDGDEMNLHHVRPESQVEARMLMGVEQQIISASVNRPIVGLVQDGVLAQYLAHGKDKRAQADHIASVCVSRGQAAAARQLSIHQDEALEYMGRRGYSVGLDDFCVSVKKSAPGKYAVAEASRTIMSDLPASNRVMGMIKAGSKGNAVNLVQLFSCVGHQTVMGGSYPAPPYAPRSSSFVSHSYTEGLTPVELWHHATAAREGMIETAIKTAKCGYTSRRMVKCMENITVAYDGTVRSVATGDVVQFLYGDDGVNSATQVLLNGKYSSVAGDAKAQAGDAVGVLAAQCIGERLTQLTLDTFHSTGLAHDHGLPKVQNVLSGYKANVPARLMGLENAYMYINVAVADVGSITKCCCALTEPEKVQCFLLGLDVEPEKLYPTVVLTTDSDKVSMLGLQVWKLAASLMNALPGLVATYVGNTIYCRRRDIIPSVRIGADWACPSVGLCANGGVAMRPQCQGPPPTLRTYTSNAADALTQLGVEAARTIIINDLKACMGGVNVRHLQLLADAMTYKGGVSPLTRAYIAKHDVHSELSKAAFETVCDVFGNAARKRSVDPMKSVSSRLCMGEMPHLGTRSFDILNRSTASTANCCTDIADFLRAPVSRKRTFEQLIAGT